MDCQFLGSFDELWQELFNGAPVAFSYGMSGRGPCVRHACIWMIFQVEEWHEFLAKDGALGMQSRFLMFHSTPRLEKATAVLDSDVYGPSSSSLFHARRMPDLAQSTCFYFASGRQSAWQHSTNT